MGSSKTQTQLATKETIKEKSPLVGNSFYEAIVEKNIYYLNAGWRHFTIMFIPDLHAQDGDRAYGEVNFDLGYINLDPNVGYDLAVETFLHELTHIVLEFTGCGAEVVESIENEDLTTRVSRGMLMLMNLNPKLFALILNVKP